MVRCKMGQMVSSDSLVHAIAPISVESTVHARSAAPAARSTAAARRPARIGMLGVAANWDTASTTSASVYRRVESATRTFARTAG